MHFKNRKGPYPSAVEAVRTAEEPENTPQCQSQSYKLAFHDSDFLLWEELRPTRIQLEILKPELMLQDSQIDSTVVIFGSARIQDPETAAQNLDEIERRLRQDPDNSDLAQEHKKAQAAVKNSSYYAQARRLGQLISQSTPENRMLVITGGGPGIMEAANRGASDVQAQSIGLNIVLPHEQIPNAYITPELCFRFHYFATRKMHFLMRAKGLVAFPGGFGTLDEIFETLTLMQVHKIKPIPVILFGPEFWTKVINFEAMVEEGTISEADVNLFQYVETAEQAWDIIANWNGMDAFSASGSY
ncbi:MAG: TIGR00730 family Rossman fold protein [Thermodesulfobacteriota bacterium]